MQYLDILLIAAFSLLILASWLFVPMLLTRRAIVKLLRVFREHNATSESTAKTYDELGITQASFFMRMWSPRDYRPRAMQYLISAQVVKVVDENKLYLDEGKLIGTKLK